MNVLFQKYNPLFSRYVSRERIAIKPSMQYGWSPVLRRNQPHLEIKYWIKHPLCSKQNLTKKYPRLCSLVWNINCSVSCLFMLGRRGLVVCKIIRTGNRSRRIPIKWLQKGWNKYNGQRMSWINTLANRTWRKNANATWTKPHTTQSKNQVMENWACLNNHSMNNRQAVLSNRSGRGSGCGDGIGVWAAKSNA